MTRTDPTSAATASVRGWRVRPAAALLVLAGLITGCSAAASGPVPGAHGSAAGGTPAHVTVTGSASGGGIPATELAAQTATHAFTEEVEEETASFVTSVNALQTAATSGDIAAAKTDEIAAQSAYDGFRALDADNAINADTLDELSTDVGSLESFGGLHAVERDLWSSGPLDDDVAGLAGQAPVAQFLLSREHLGPEAIGVVAVDQLDWVVDDALPVDQEQYSQLGLIDVAATESAAQASFTTIRPLAQLVDPSLTATVSSQFASLDQLVRALGPPATTPLASVDPSVRLSLSVQLDATASTLAQLSARLTPFGTEGAPS
jgi:iron uptake system EfeUOB component EfeO/EfeM